MYLDRQSPALEEKRSHSGVPLQIGVASPTPLDKREGLRLSMLDRLNFEVVWSANHLSSIQAHSPLIRLYLKPF
jgi:hypothetical protein